MNTDEIICCVHHPNILDLESKNRNFEIHSQKHHCQQEKTQGQNSSLWICIIRQAQTNIHSQQTLHWTKHLHHEHINDL